MKGDLILKIYAYGDNSGIAFASGHPKCLRRAFPSIFCSNPVHQYPYLLNFMHTSGVPLWKVVALMSQGIDT